MSITPPIQIFFAAMGTILLIDSIGSVLSRKLGFYYGRLGYLSFVVYFFFGYLQGAQSDFQTTGILAALLGFVDSTLGFRISRVLKANYGKYEDRIKEGLTPAVVFIVAFLSFVVGSIGYSLS
ncbi:MAG: hypothetical protein NTW29_13305 [Bacteroidetes bacterium]|nr:hypothetical protein [Bacteroidota bacterium]